MAPTLDHIDLVVSDLERSLEFYRGLLGPLGWVHEGGIDGERGERVVYLGGAPPDRPVVLGLRQSQSDAHPLPLDRYAVGVHHVAFDAPSREAVDDRAAWLRDNGFKLESEPQDYDYASEYYAVFFYDPDGIKLEVVHKPGK